LEEWELASKDNWFESVEDINGLERLVKIAGHSECQLCLDYRGEDRQIPGLTYIFLGYEHEEALVFDSVIDFLDALIAFKAEVAVPALEASSGNGN
jgi:hypothetical protein